MLLNPMMEYIVKIALEKILWNDGKIGTGNG